MLNFSKKKNAEKAAASEDKSGAAASVKFSGRIAGVFGKMYRMILSVNLQQNVAQIESGERSACGNALPERFYYSDMVSKLSASVHPDDRERFLADFDQKALCKALSSGTNSFAGRYCFAVGGAEAFAKAQEDPAGTEDGENAPEQGNVPELKYFEIRADRIPDGGDVSYRCIIYVREIDEKQYEGTPDAPKAGPTGWNDIRIGTFFGGEGVMYFEYDSEKDEMYLHDDPNEDAPSAVIKNYLRTMDARSDWSIIHGDAGKVSSLISDAALKGKSGSAEIRYRRNGEKTKKFRYHRLLVAPAGASAPGWVIGTLEDIDDEIKAKNNDREINTHISEMVATQFSSIFEIDLERDRIYSIYNKDGVFVRDERSASSFSTLIKKQIEAGIIGDQFVSEFRKWLEPNYLEHKTLANDYEFECRLKLPGSLEYRWYSEVISKLSGTRRYLRIRRDINDLQNVRQQEYKVEELNHYLQYNRKIMDLMVSLVESRNVESGLHVERVRTLTRILLEDLAERSPLYEITPEQIEMYSKASTMHDVGKILVPDSILNKTGPLTDEELEIMHRHTVDGARIIEGLDLPGQEDLLKCSMDVALHHHERYDGGGYPDGLVGDEISIAAQAVGLADIADALVSERCYKAGFSFDETDDMIFSGECGVFNPRLLESFRNCREKMMAVYNKEQ